MKRLDIRWIVWLASPFLLAMSGEASAADFDGAQLSVLWGVPFAGILLSIALMPLLVPHFWHHHYGKVAAAWGMAFLAPFALVFGSAAAGTNTVHALFAEYIPFIICSRPCSPCREVFSSVVICTAALA